MNESFSLVKCTRKKQSFVPGIRENKVYEQILKNKGKPQSTIFSRFFNKK